MGLRLGRTGVGCGPELGTHQESGMCSHIRLYRHIVVFLIRHSPITIMHNLKVFLFFYILYILILTLIDLDSNLLDSYGEIIQFLCKHMFIHNALLV